MLEAITMGFDETTLAYDLQRAHSADVWFLRARYFFWGTVSTIVGFLVGHALPLFGVNVYKETWEGFWNFWHHLVG
jgi:hypothetical protein